MTGSTPGRPANRLDHERPRQHGAFLRRDRLFGADEAQLTVEHADDAGEIVAAP